MARETTDQSGEVTVPLFARLKLSGFYTVNNMFLPIRRGRGMWILSLTDCKPSEGGKLIIQRLHAHVVGRNDFLLVI